MHLTDEERKSYEENGYLIRKGAVPMDIIEEMRTATEELCGSIAANASGRKFVVSTDYVFEPDTMSGIFIKWEPGDEPVVQGLEPFADLHPTFMKYEMHPAFTEPCGDLLGLEPDNLNMYTEKLNFKRAHKGGKYALHQDYPYWIGEADDPANMVTVWLALDDADRENACLEVLPGSHKLGRVPGKVGGTEFEKNEIDPDTFDDSGMVHAEVEAGDAIFFGPYLVHRSAANTSDRDRRALLYTYQKAGQIRSREKTRDFVNKMAGASSK
jgi:hypothetical protein